jgi:flagellar capping protein FliD
VFVNASSNSGRYAYLSEVGLELSSDGTLSFDEDTFDSAVTGYPDDVQKLFQGDTGTSGAFNSLKSVLSNLDGSAGLIKTARDSIKTTIDRFDDRISRQQNMLELRRKELMKQYAAADEAMSRLSQLSSSISNLNRSIG